MINKFLLYAARTAGIEKHISFHTARHTASYLAKVAGISTDVIKDALGHSKFATTEGYLKSLSDDYINKEYGKLYE